MSELTDISIAFSDVWDDLDISPDSLDAMLRELRVKEWAETSAHYHAQPDDFHAAWWYLQQHPIVHDEVAASYFEESFDVYVVKVDPHTSTIEDDKARNTQTQVWLEFGPRYFEVDMSPEEWCANHYDLFDGSVPSHDVELDCGADTYEQAIVELARRVSERYGDDRSKVYSD